MSCKKRLNSDANTIMEYTHKKKKQMIYKCACPHTTPHTHTTISTGADGVHPSVVLSRSTGADGGAPRFTEEEVTALLHNQEQIFRAILEEKLREQFNMFNQMYIDTIFKDYKNTDVSYIN